MPIYSYRCENCAKGPFGGILEEFFSTYVKPLSIICPHCKGVAKFILSPVSFKFITKKMIEEKRMGIVPYEKGSDKDAKRAKEYQEEKCRKNIQKMVENTVMDFDIPG